MSLKKTISGVCKGHLELFLIRFVQVYMKLKGTNKQQRWKHLTTWSQEMHRSHSINAGFHNNLRSTYLSPLRRANNTQKITVLTLFARSLNGNPTTGIKYTVKFWQWLKYALIFHMRLYFRVHMLLCSICACNET